MINGVQRLFICSPALLRCDIGFCFYPHFQRRVVCQWCLLMVSRTTNWTLGAESAQSLSQNRICRRESTFHLFPQTVLIAEPGQRTAEEEPKVLNKICSIKFSVIPMKSGSETLAQSCPTLRDPMECSPPGSPVRAILQARPLEWEAGWEGGLEENGYMCVYGRVPSLLSWNYHNVVNHLYPNTK